MSTNIIVADVFVSACMFLMDLSFPLILLYVTVSGNLQVHPEGKYLVDVDKSIDIAKLTPSTRVALRSGSYMLHVILPSKVDPLVNLMKVEKVPDSTYDMIGGLDQQIKEIKEVRKEFHCTVHFVVSYYTVNTLYKNSIFR